MKFSEAKARLKVGKRVHLDYIISEIAAEMGILEDQENEWKNA